jgi:hypothetical protein
MATAIAANTEDYKSPESPEFISGKAGEAAGRGCGNVQALRAGTPGGRAVPGPQWTAGGYSKERPRTP